MHQTNFENENMGCRKPRDRACRCCGAENVAWALPKSVNMRGHLFTDCDECGANVYLGTTEAGKRLAKATRDGRGA